MHTISFFTLGFKMFWKANIKVYLKGILNYKNLNVLLSMYSPDYLSHLDIQKQMIYSHTILYTHIKTLSNLAYV